MELFLLKKYFIRKNEELLVKCTTLSPSSRSTISKMESVPPKGFYDRFFDNGQARESTNNLAGHVSNAGFTAVSTSINGFSTTHNTAINGAVVTLSDRIDQNVVRVTGAIRNHLDRNVDK